MDCKITAFFWHTQIFSLENTFFRVFSSFRYLYLASFFFSRLIRWAAHPSSMFFPGGLWYVHFPRIVSASFFLLFQAHPMSRSHPSGMFIPGGFYPPPLPSPPLPPPLRLPHRWMIRCGLFVNLPPGLHLLPMDAQWMQKGCSMVALPNLSTLS